MRRTYFYINCPGDSRLPEQELIAFDKAGYAIVLNRIAIDRVPPYVAATDRPELKSLLRRAAPHGLLLVLDLSALGCSPRDILATLMQCRKDKVSVRCVELGDADLAGRPEPQAVRTLRAIVRLKMATRSERSKAGLKAVRDSGQRTGRPASLSRHDREDIVRSLEMGHSVSKIARDFGTSRQTIMRIREASATHAAG